MAVYLKKNIPHTFKNVGDGPAEFVLIAAPSGFEKFVAECGERIDSIPSKLEIGPAAIEKLMQTVGRYGLAVLPDHQPNAEAPPRAKDRAFWVLGERVTVKLTSPQTDGNFTAAEVVSRPGGGVPPHRHRAMDEFFYVIEGEYEFDLDGKPTRAPAGTFVHVPKGVLHGFRNVGKSEARLADFHTPGGFERFFEECGVECTDPTKPPAADPPDMQKLLRIFEKHGMELPV